MSCASVKFSNSSFARNWLVWVVLLCLGRSPVFADQSVVLTWNPSPNTNAVAYKIYYGGVSGDYTNTVVVNIPATTWMVSGLTEGETYYFSATTVSASGAESAFSNEASYVIPLTNTNSPPNGTIVTTTTTNQPPTLDPIANLTIYQNAGPQTVALTGISAGTSGNPTVNITAIASDPTIISTPTVLYTNSDSMGTLVFAPVTNALGSATVTVTVDNGGVSNNPTSQVFTITVVPAPAPAVNQSPTLDAITNMTIYQNSGIQTVDLTGISPGVTNEYVSVSIWAYTSDSTIIPTPTVNYTSPNSAGTLTFAPVANALGTATVTVKVNNGVNNFSQVFTVTVIPAPAVILPPTLTAIGNVTLYENSGSKMIALAGIAQVSTNVNQALLVSAVSDNPALIPTPTVNYSSPNNFGTLTLTPTTNALGSATVTVTVTDANNITVNQAFTVTVVTPSPGSQPPTLDPIANVSMIQGASPQTITLTGISPGTITGRQVLRFSTTSSNPRIVSAPMIRYAGQASTAQMNLMPMSGGTGAATITVTANNGGRSNNIVSQSFTVTVAPIQPPTLDPVANIAVAQNAGAQTITLTGITAGSTTGNQTLKVTANSNNPRLVSMPTIQYSSPSNTALLTFKPVAIGNSTGTATLTVTVTDADRFNNTVRQQFTVTVTAPATNAPATVSASVVEISKPVTAAPSSVVSSDVAAKLTTVANSSGQFSFQVTGMPGAKYVVEATSDLTHWTALETNTAPFAFQDSANGGQRFYRAVYLDNLQ